MLACVYHAVALPTGYSLVSSLALAVLTLAAMQLFREQLGVEGGMAVLGGFIGSCFFVFVLTVSQCVCTTVYVLVYIDRCELGCWQPGHSHVWRGTLHKTLS